MPASQPTSVYVLPTVQHSKARRMPAMRSSEERRLQLQSVAAKDLHIGDQVVLLNDDERAGFSERLLQAMDEGRLRNDKQTRSTWVLTLRAIRLGVKVSVP